MIQSLQDDNAMLLGQLYATNDKLAGLQAEVQSLKDLLMNFMAGKHSASYSNVDVETRLDDLINAVEILDNQDFFFFPKDGDVAQHITPATEEQTPTNSTQN